MTLEKLEKAAGGKVVFHSSWLGLASLALVSYLLWAGKLPLPAFANDVEKVSNKITTVDNRITAVAKFFQVNMTALSDEQKSMRLTSKHLDTRLRASELYQAQQKAEGVSSNRRLKRLEDGQTSIVKSLGEIKNLIIRNNRN